MIQTKNRFCPLHPFLGKNGVLLVRWSLVSVFDFRYGQVSGLYSKGGSNCFEIVFWEWLEWAHLKSEKNLESYPNFPWVIQISAIPSCSSKSVSWQILTDHLLVPSTGDASEQNKVSTIKEQQTNNKHANEHTKIISSAGLCCEEAMGCWSDHREEKCFIQGHQGWPQPR